MSPTFEIWLPISTLAPCRGGITGIPNPSVISLSLPFPVDVIGSVVIGRSGLNRCKL